MNGKHKPDLVQKDTWLRETFSLFISFFPAYNSESFLKKSVIK